MRSARPARLIIAGTRQELIDMSEQAPPWPKQGPASYFPSIEKKYGRSIAHWQQIIADCGLEKHMAIVGYLKAEHGMGHGHANALVGWTLAGNLASSLSARGLSPHRLAGRL
jgi:hypothetical protein